MDDTHKQIQEEMEGSAGVTTASSNTAPTNRSSSPTGPQPTSTPLGNISSDRQTAQVIQQTLHRPQSMTAQYLQQMYTAQQQHILLQTAALQQQHQQNLTATHILTSTEQAAQTNSRQATSSPPSSNGTVSQLASVSQTSITMPTSPVTQPIGRIQVTSSNSTGGAISQQAMLLGNSSPTGSQMYLRTQMVILTPGATVAAVQPDLNIVSSVSSQSASSQVQSLALHTHLPGALTTPQAVQIKPSLPGQTLLSPPPKMSICPLKSTQLSQNLVETSRTSFTPVHSHALVRHCPSGQRVAPHQFIIQQSSNAHRQVQPITLRVTAQDSCTPPIAFQTRTTPTTATVQSQHTELLSAPSSANQSKCSVPPAMLPDPPPLHLGPVLEPVSQYTALSCPPPLTMALPRLVQPQRLSLRSVQTAAVRSDHMVVSEEQFTAGEGVVQLPFQNLLPPQTVAVDLKVQPSTQTEAPSQATQLLTEGRSVNLLKAVEEVCPQTSRTPSPPPLSPTDQIQTGSNDAAAQPENCTADQDQPCIRSSRSVIRSPEDGNSSPPPLLSSAVRSTSRPPPASLPGNPEGRPSEAISRPHILTHLIEGFVIREGLEPFPVRSASLEVNLQATLPEDREDEELTLMDADHPEDSTDSDIDNPPAEDEQTIENLPNVLECEFCGKRGFAHTFLRSKRFCSMKCVKRFNVSCKKRLNRLRPEKIARWPHRSMGKRGRPPTRLNGRSSEHFLRPHLEHSHPIIDNQMQSNVMWMEREEEEENPPIPMTTRLRLQAERENEQDRGRDPRRPETCSSSERLLDSRPSQWSVEQVCSFISSLPGGSDIAGDFRSQEIDGQALLLLTEDHLMNAMNMRLGPALKICAHINALKQP